MLHAGDQATKFKVEVFAIHVIVPGHFCVEIWKQVGSGGVVGGIKLRAELGVEGEGEDDLAGGYKLLRVLQRNSPLEMIGEVIDRAKFRRTSIGNTHVDVGVFTQGERQVRRHGRKPGAVWSLQTPG